MWEIRDESYSGSTLLKGINAGLEWPDHEPSQSLHEPRPCKSQHIPPWHACTRIYPPELPTMPHQLCVLEETDKSMSSSIWSFLIYLTGKQLWSSCNISCAIKLQDTVLTLHDVGEQLLLNVARQVRYAAANGVVRNGGCHQSAVRNSLQTWLDRYLWQQVRLAPGNSVRFSWFRNSLWRGRTLLDAS